MTITRSYPSEFQLGVAFAREADQQDPLRSCRDQFHIPQRADGQDMVYFAGNSLGLQPRGVAPRLQAELDDWATLAVDAHFDGKTPWYSYHEVMSETGARLVGARPGEVVTMNSLTVNLHLMMVSFYRPNGKRNKIIIENCAFPSDSYAVKSQLHYHGIDPEEGLIELQPREGEVTLRTEDVLETLARHADDACLLMMAGVNYFTGQAFDMATITKAAHQHGLMVGWDLAHAAGNLELHLHDWDVDFAAWCNYKYLNSGPGAVAACFVHDRHGQNDQLPRFAGWWGNDPATRFRMHLEPDFIPKAGADGWQLSNPPILALAPVAVSYAMFDDVGMSALRRKSDALTGYLAYLLKHVGDDRLTILTPESQRGCQLSLAFRDGGEGVFAALSEAGVVCDFRKPDVIRAAPVPLYNRFEDVYGFAKILAEQLGKSMP
ncbi:MAG: kynureninase [Phycisphaerae bacterium]